MIIPSYSLGPKVPGSGFLDQVFRRRPRERKPRSAFPRRLPWSRLLVSPKDHLQGHLNSCIHNLMRLYHRFVCFPFSPLVFRFSSSMPVFPAFLSNSRFRAAVLFCRQFSVIFLMPVLKRKADKVDGLNWKE